MRKKIHILLVLMVPLWVAGQQVRKINYRQAIAIALGGSYPTRYYNEEKEAMRFSYLYNKAQFKPRLDLNLFAPSWDEGVNAVYSADTLPVYNSTSSLRAGGNLGFTVMLPTGGNFSLSSNMYWEKFMLASGGSFSDGLRSIQAYSRFSLSFSQPVFTANALRENLRAAQLEYDKSVCYFNRVQMDIIYNVTNAFYQVYKASFELQINSERLANSKEALRVTRLKQEAGDLPEGEILIAEISVAQDEARLLESQGKLDALNDEFKLLVGLNLDEEIELEAEMQFESFVVDEKQAVEQARGNREELQEAAYDIELQEIALARARRERELKGSINAYYDFTGLSTRADGNPWQLFNSSFGNMADRPANRGITFTLSYPIADWGRGRNLESKARHILNERHLDRENQTRIIEKEVREIVRKVREAETRYRINTKNRDAAQKSFKISQMRFENGELTSQELSIEQNRLSDVQLAYIDSYIVYRLAVANLERKTLYDFKNNRPYVKE
ncbi:MAG: TolC family protein [Bacteroidales bacterium]|nr:TolC family protein [Bacteroidales bacterium]MDD3666684.1 TolC family protein [Bacteroidales bacterium]